MENLNSLVRDSAANAKGAGFGIKAVVTTLVTAGILFIVGVLIFSKVDSSIDTGSFTAAQNATVDTIRNTVLDSFELAVIALVVLAAVAILSILFLLGSS